MIVTEYKERKKEIKEIIIDINDDVKLTKEENTICFEKGQEKSEVVINPVYVKANIKEKKIVLEPINSKKKARSVLNTTNKLIKNAIEGLKETFTYKLTVVYSHFPMTVKAEEDFVVVTNFLGEKKPRKTKILPGCKVEVKGKDVIVSGHNKYAAGQTAGNIEKITRVTKKDYRVFDDGCYIIEKPIIKK